MVDEYQPKNGDHVRVTRVTGDGHRRVWVGVISGLHDDLDGFMLTGDDFSSAFAGAKTLLAERRIDGPIIQTVEAAPLVNDGATEAPVNCTGSGQPPTATETKED